MQIVIEIPKGFYEHVKGHKDIFTYGLINGEKIGEIIANGSVLPEKHGRLIDADAIKKKYPLMYNDLGMEFNNGIHEALDEAPTIIEADKVGRGEI